MPKPLVDAMQDAWVGSAPGKPARAARAKSCIAHRRAMTPRGWPAVLGLVILTAGAFSSETMIHPTQEDIARARECYRLDATAPGLWADADLFPLPDSRPIELEATLVRHRSLPGSLREVSRMIRWTAGAGHIRYHPPRDSTQSAVWSPPSRSLTVEVQAEAIIKLDPTSPVPNPAPIVINKRVDFLYLTPISSSYLQDGVLDGYSIGEYPDPFDPDLSQKYQIDSNWHLLHPDRYQVPDVFYRADPATKLLRISPHVPVGYFMIDYPWTSLGKTQYIAVDLHLVRKIEDLIELINAEGEFRITGIKPIYGFRPPSFNLGTIEQRPGTTKKVPFSMHQYGRAMDFIIDENGDDVMDDINGDGAVDIFDAARVMHYVNLLDHRYRAQERWAMVGGAGLYDSHDFEGRVQTPYIHVDTRGFQNENGELIRWADGWPEGVELRWGRM